MQMRAAHGPLSAQQFSPELVNADRFWSMVDKSGECWLWMGQRNRHGYGSFYVHRFRRASVGAHRVAHTLTHGVVPDGLSVLHSCDNPPCVNPAHLRVGTHRENLDELVKRGPGTRPAPLPRPNYRLGGKLDLRRTHCKRGHPFDAINTKWYVKDGFRCRACGECQRIRQGARSRRNVA